MRALQRRRSTRVTLGSASYLRAPGTGTNHEYESGDPARHRREPPPVEGRVSRIPRTMRPETGQLDRPPRARSARNELIRPPSLSHPPSEPPRSRAPRGYERISRMDLPAVSSLRGETPPTPSLSETTGRLGGVRSFAMNIGSLLSVLLGAILATLGGIATELW